MTDVRTKVAQHLIYRELEELDSRNPKIIIDGLSVDTPQIPPISPHVPEASWKTLLERDAYRWPMPKEFLSSQKPMFRFRPRVAIIGAGVAGLRTAMMLQTLNIPYTIYEASERVGGRVFTYHFKEGGNPGSHDYYDVGAMRFPDNDANKSTFNLFRELDLDEKMIPYIMGIPENIRLYNNIRTSAQTASAQGDHFKEGKVNKGIVPEEYINMKYTPSSGKEVYGVNACAAAAFEPYRIPLVYNIKTGWELLMQHDWASTRSFLRQVVGYPWGAVQWMESRNSGTGGYDRAFSEAILDSLEFDYPTQPGQDVKWWCLEGGSETLTQAMLKKLRVRPRLGHRVSAASVRPHISDRWWEWSMQVKLTVDEYPSMVFDHVVSTVSFADLRTIDTSKCHLSYKQREAIRSINYGPAVKVGIKFKTRWWQKPEFSQKGGASMTDRQSRVVVYPSYGIDDDLDKPGVLMVTYNWHQDATRFGALISSNDWTKQLDPSTEGRTHSETVLLEQIYGDLVALHGKTVEWYKEQTLDYHAFDWYHNEFTMGAFAHFVAGQFGNFFPDITTTAGFGRFHFAGEVASTHHAWVAGALDSAWRVVYEILKKDCPWKIPLFKRIYGNSVIFGDDEDKAAAQVLRGTYLKELEEALQ